ncbi:MAG: hypothetical protein N2053_00255 [Chitinispirillaceae bacterium]|nr:hypothetical protein [Chitinispirillaceae bacterium]
MDKCKIKHLSFFSLIFLFCAAVPSKFSISNSYTKENFVGWDLGNHTIGICPFLTDDGWLDEKKFSYVKLTKKMYRQRPDLEFQSPESVHYLISKNFSPNEVNVIYKNLFNGSILFLQNYDTLWNNINYDYLLLIKIKSGSYIKTFDNLTKKKIKLEVELWNTKEKECVWRREIKGECWDKRIDEKEFIEEAVIRIVSLLPSALPAYDSKEW